MAQDQGLVRKMKKLLWTKKKSGPDTIRLRRSYGVNNPLAPLEIRIKMRQTPMVSYL